jgi:hypothetical protein
MFSEEEKLNEQKQKEEERTPKRVEMAFVVLQHLNSTESSSIFSEGRELSIQEQRVRVLALRVIGQYIAGETGLDDVPGVSAQRDRPVDPRSGSGKLDAFGDRDGGRG